jgi:hypothetical protein
LFEVAQLCAIHARRVTLSKLSLNELFIPLHPLCQLEMFVKSF